MSRRGRGLRGPLVAHRAEPHQRHRWFSAVHPPSLGSWPWAADLSACRCRRRPHQRRGGRPGAAGPIPLGVRDQRRAGQPGLEAAPHGQRTGAFLQRASFAGGVEGGQRPPGRRLVDVAGLHPVLGQRPRDSRAAPPSAPRSLMNLAMSTMPCDVGDHGARGVDAAVRVDQPGQPLRRSRSSSAGSAAISAAVTAAVTEHAADPRRVLQQLSRHQPSLRRPCRLILVRELLVGLPLGGSADEPSIPARPLVGIGSRCGSCPGGEGGLRSHHGGMAEQVTQDHHRVGLGQVERQRRIRAAAGPVAVTSPAACA